jgi:hypothetical protein
MSWRAKKFMCDRLASIAAIVLIAAGSAHAANTGTETRESAAPAGLNQSPGDTDAAAATAATGDTATPSSANPAPRPPGRVRAGGSLQHRVDVLSKALQLDARQRTELLTILESQRQAVGKIWSDPALLPAERTPATRAVQERTADQIRAILSEEQKKRYNPPKPQGAEPPPNVEEWMRKQSQTQARQEQQR